MAPKCRVLIVDRSRESRDILRMLLERTGAETLEATSADGASQLTESAIPDLIVFDSDSDSCGSGTSTERLGQFASRNHIPIVVLGTARRNVSPLPTGHLVTKPYHYAPLIRRIEQILGNRS